MNYVFHFTELRKLSGVQIINVFQRRVMCIYYLWLLNSCKNIVNIFLQQFISMSAMFLKSTYLSV